MTDNPNPLVSICIPVYNGALMIDRALESCINQTYRNIEIIVVDNASSDDSGKIVKKYSEKDNRIKYFRNETNIGPLKNLLKPAEFARGHYYQLLAHDDWLSKNYIEEAVNLFSEKIGGVFSRIIAFDQAGDAFSFGLQFDQKPGILPLKYFLKNAYKSQLGANSMLGLLRTEDVKMAIPFVLGLFNHSEFGKFYEINIDLLAFEILSKYPFFACTNRSAYVKTTHSRNTGKQFGYGYMGLTIMEKEMAFRDGFMGIYKDKFRRLFSFFRITFNINAVNKALVEFIKGNISRSDIKRELSKKNFRLLFAGYSNLEKILVFLGIVPGFLIKFLGFIGRRISGKFKKNKLTHSPGKIFLEKNGDNFRFKI